MQIKYIDENTIRVSINKEELSARGLKVLDLLGNKEKIQEFFYSILSEVDADHSFTRDTPVSFQVMPNNNGLDLLITKVNDLNNPDLRQMIGAADSDEEQLVPNEFFDLDQEQVDSEIESITSQDNYIKSHSYRFNDLGEVIELANSLQTFNLASSLYLYKDTYFMKLLFVDENYFDINPKDAWLIANEYGIRVSDDQMRVVQNQGQCIIQADALGILKKYFN